MPVGVPLPPAAATVAVRDTCWPATDGFCDEDMVVVVDPDVLCTRVGELLARKFESPRYAALIVWLPAESEALNDAVALSSTTGAPAFAPSITNCTLPVGTSVLPDEGDTVAVSVIGLSDTDGFCDDKTATVLAWLTFCSSCAEYPAAKLESPE